MPRILAVDCGMRSGITYEAATDIPKPTFFDLGGNSGFAYGLACSRLRLHLIDCIQATATELVVYEAPLPAKNTNNPISTIAVLYGLPAVIEMVCYDLNIECAYVNVQTIKKHIAGHGHADKKEVRKAANLIFGMNVKDENAADSLALWAYAKALRQPSWSPSTTPLFGGRR
jgi:Holliday junction resolvasome RuvABC endonuclease subunit